MGRNIHGPHDAVVMPIPESLVSREISSA